MTQTVQKQNRVEGKRIELDNSKLFKMFDRPVQPVTDQSN